MILPPMKKSDLVTKTIHYSTSRAWRLGRAVLHARKTKQSTIQAILDQEGGIVLCGGKVGFISTVVDSSVQSVKRQVSCMLDAIKYFHSTSK